MPDKIMHTGWDEMRVDEGWVGTRTSESYLFCIFSNVHVNHFIISIWRHQIGKAFVSFKSNLHRRTGTDMHAGQLVVV